MDWRENARQLKAEGKSLTEISLAIKPNFPELTDHQLWEKARTAIRQRKPSISSSQFPVGVFADPHAPFTHKGYIQFIKDTFRKHKVQRIVCLGDLFDQYCFSRHEKDPEAMNQHQEIDKACEVLKDLFKAFPEGELIPGNHDERLLKLACRSGIGRRFVQSYRDLFGLPKGWNIHEKGLIMDGVMYKHGEGCSGKNGALDAALHARMSVAIGHFHSLAGCQYQFNSVSTVFGMNVGCGVDEQSYAFAYGRNSKDKSILGCGIVFSESNATFVPMGPQYM